MQNYLILVILPMLFAMYTQSKVSSTFSKYSRVRNTNGYTGAEIAKKILQSAGIYDVSIERIRGNLTDHYDPKNKVLRLSDSVYNETSVSAIGVAAHECGHAVQHARGYGFLKIRHAIYPVVRFGSNLSVPLIFLGFILQLMNLVAIGIILFLGIVIFQLVTLPVEFNASNRAIEILNSHQYLSSDEIKPAQKVLNAAALTYVAATIVSIGNLLRFVLMFLGGRDD